jgi:hypothetical protein
VTTRKTPDGEVMLEELKRAARELGFEVRDEELSRDRGYRPRGGQCRVADRDVIFLDRKAPVADRIDTLCAALAGRDLEGVFLSPAARARVGDTR